MEASSKISSQTRRRHGVRRSGTGRTEGIVLGENKGWFRKVFRIHTQRRLMSTYQLELYCNPRVLAIEFSGIGCEIPLHGFFKAASKVDYRFHDHEVKPQTERDPTTTTTTEHWERVAEYFQSRIEVERRRKIV